VWSSKLQSEIENGSRGFDTKYEEEENGSRGFDTKYNRGNDTHYKSEHDMYVGNHGFGAVQTNDESIEKNEGYSEVEECTPDIQSKEGVRSDKMVLCSVGVDVGDVCGNDVGQNMGKVLHI
jgi:hypothetical protein